MARSTLGISSGPHAKTTRYFYKTFTISRLTSSARPMISAKDKSFYGSLRGCVVLNCDPLWLINVGNT